MDPTNSKGDDANDTVTPYIISAYKLTQEDATWIISNAFIILTMQTGIHNTHTFIFLQHNIPDMMKPQVLECWSQDAFR